MEKQKEEEVEKHTQEAGGEQNNKTIITPPSPLPRLSSLLLGKLN